MLAVRPCRATDKAALIVLWKACGLTRPWNDPAKDIDLALATATSAILVGEGEDGALAASAMVGFDGHRGWLYYVAVNPALQGHGHGRTICAHAEAWLKSIGCPKVEVVMRGENKTVQGFYASIDYLDEDRVLMAKWLVPPPVANQPADHTPAELPVVVTHLEMTAPPTAAPLHPPVLDLPLSLLRLPEPGVSFYRYLYNSVGEPLFWWERRAIPDDELQAAISAETTELFVLYASGAPAGYVELDAVPMPEAMEIAWFGLLPEFTGRGLGPYLLDWSVHAAWNRDPRPGRVILHTCTADHPKALATYQRAGFQPCRQERKTIPDPRLSGLIPKHQPFRMPDGSLNRLEEN